MRRDYEAIIRDMRTNGRPDLVHFAGAAHRDPAAARVVEQWLIDPTASEADLRARAIAQAVSDAEVDAYAALGRSEV